MIMLKRRNDPSCCSFRRHQKRHPKAVLLRQRCIHEAGLMTRIRTPR